MVDCFQVNNLAEAVQLSKKLAVENDVVLFSPACKSFDQFLNFEHRGEVFKESVSFLNISEN
jgi:UDP-N-acetylmuramoylalanine--D-glutamate ligase